MSAGSQKLQEAIRGGNVWYVDKAAHRDAFTGVTTPLPIKGGGITVDVTQPNRRMLNTTLPPLQSLFDTLSSPGGEITVTRQLTYLDHTTEVQPLGVFCVTEQSMNYTPDAEFTLTCPDRYFRVQSNGFGAARASIPSNTGWQEIKRLVEGAWPNTDFPFPGWASLPNLLNPDQSATAKVGTLIWSDGDRSNAIQSLLKLNSLQLYFDPGGLAVLQPIPVLTASSTSVWTVGPGDRGVLKDAQRIRDTSVVHNVIVLTSTASDIVLPTIEVANTHLYAADPLSSLGPLGRVTLQLSDNYRSTAQMTAAGKVQLSKELSIQNQLSLKAFPNPALEGYDVISAILPAGDSGTQPPAEQHLIESVSIPFDPSGDQAITCRATRATGDDSV